MGGAPHSLALGDLDRDGRLDVVSARDSTLWISLGNGDGTLATSIDLATVSGAGRVRIEDMNGDAWPDLVFGTSWSSLSILRQIPPVAAVGLAPDASHLSLAIAPNPARGAVDLTFTLSREAGVDVELLDVSGRHVATLARGVWPAGNVRLRWDGTGLRPGVYVMRLEADRAVATRRIVWID